MASASQSSTIAQLDITDCPVCSELFTDPRSLSCIHLFCLKCIEGYGSNKEPGDNMPCPVCQKEFTIPEGGLGELSRNSFIEKLLQIKQLAHSRKKSFPCDACEADEDDGEERGTAVIYCVECREKLCDSCAKSHKRVNMTRSHKQIQLDDSAALEKELLLRNTALSACDKHKDQTLSVFCRDCKMAICVICYISSHKQHDTADITEVIDKFRQQMTLDIDHLVDGAEQLGEMSKSIEQQKEAFVKQATDTEDEIINKAGELKQIIENNKQALLVELTTKKQSVIQHLDKLNQEVKHKITLMQNLKKYSEELSSKGSASDIARDVSAVHDRSDELLKLQDLQVIERSRCKMDDVLMLFTPSSLITAHEDNIVGNVNFQDQQPCNPTLIHTIPSSGTQIVGVTTLNDQLFVVRYSTSSRIEQYDLKTFTVQRYISVPGLSLSYGLASCATNNCLYVSGYNTNYIYRVALSTPNSTVTSWNVAVAPAGLFVNQAKNVIVASYGGHRLYEYATVGTLIREINIQQVGITHPWYALQLSDDQFVVSAQNRVHLVGIDGTIVRTYGSATAGSGVSQMNDPLGMAIAKSGSILVADRNNNRIVILNPSLTSAGILQLPEGCTLQHPCGVCTDEARGRLYVGEFNGCRLLVFDNIGNVGRSAMYNSVFTDDD